MTASRSITLLRMFLVTLALAGAGVSGALLRNHDGGWRLEREGVPAAIMPCAWAAPGSQNCADVIGSRWGSFDFFVGQQRILIPTALVGIAYFLTIAFWFLLAGPPLPWTRFMRGLTALMLCGGLAGSVALIYTMAARLGEWCPLCLIAHALNGGVLVCGFWQLRKMTIGSEVTADSNTLRSLVYLLRGRLAMGALGIAALGSAGVWFYFDAVITARRHWRGQETLNRLTDALAEDREFVLREYFAQPIIDLNILGHTFEKSSSSSNDQANLVVFTDYSSRQCVCVDGLLGGLISNAMGHLRVDVRVLPSGVIQNQNSGTQIIDKKSQKGLQAALAAKAAYLQGGGKAFARMHRLLFMHRHDSKINFVDLARRTKLDPKRFLADMSASKAHQAVKNDAALARVLGVVQAPAVFFNGRRVPPLCLNSEVFWDAMAELTLEDNLSHNDEMSDPNALVLKEATP